MRAHARAANTGNVIKSNRPRWRVWPSLDDYPPRQGVAEKVKISVRRSGHELSLNCRQQDPLSQPNFANPG